ncbi:hypothetical protein [uncultured Eubacterium sp.]|uniref:hypothetical protein n=1 Tax=uncultured Eubacterium sp. TaxID=165185 RepID=UPI00259414AC|nr:hypothetical protein [uncultured Eubacterium sp.]
MVGINLYDSKEINDSSDLIKEQISKVVASYIVEFWDECVKVNHTKVNDDEYETLFEISL